MNLWFKEKGHFGKIPEPYELINGLYTENEKIKMENKKNIIIYCPLCKHKFNLSYFDEHFTRCSSVNYIVGCRKKHLKKETQLTDIDKLWKYDNEQFEEIYKNFVRGIRKYITSNNELNAIKHLLGEVDYEL